MGKRFAVLLLAVFGLAACGDEVPAPPAVEVPAWAKVSPEQIAEAKKHGVPVAFENDLGMRFVLIPAGTFLMGSPEDEEGRGHDETQHEVTITKPYYMQITEVTNEQYLRFRSEHYEGPRAFAYDPDLRASNYPVSLVDHAEAREFAAWLSGRSAQRLYRLPTEAEWERACRAGGLGRFFWGTSESDGHLYANGLDSVTLEEYVESGFKSGPKGWSHDDGYRTLAPVACFRPNKWGLFDMTGNLWEWVADRYAAYPSTPVQDPRGPAEGERKVVRRGGSWGCEPNLLRSAVRLWETPPSTGIYDGFRLVSPLPESKDGK